MNFSNHVITAFEDCKSLIQDLTFNVFSVAMRKAHLETNELSMKAMKMIDYEGDYSNLALLLSDQCPFTIKLAIFTGKHDDLFVDRHEFSSSLIQQFEEAENFLDLLNKNKSVIKGFNRTDYREYKVEDLREALTNSIVHRDYTVKSSNIINVYNDRMVFMSQGVFIDGMDMDSMMIGISRPRNEHLADVFYKLGIVKSVGFGVKSICNSYNDCPKKPIFEIA